MLDLVHFQVDTGEPVPYPCEPTDKIYLSTLATALHFEEGEIKFDGMLIPQKDGYSTYLWEQIKGMLDGAGTKERPIVATGRRRLPAENNDFVFKDRFREWIKHMLLPQHTLTRLSQHEHDLEKVLFPEQPGKLPMLMSTYNEILGRDSDVAEKYLIPADHSKLPLFVTQLVFPPPALVYSEVNATARLVYNFEYLIYYWKTYSSFAFTYKLLFNLKEKAGDSHSETTRKRLKPDMLFTASGCTFLVGEDKCSSIIDGKRDLEGKMQPLSAMFYGEVQFILGYIAVGNEFQWVYINKNGKIREVGQRLDLSNDTDRCQFLLSIGYAYQLISVMVRTVPEVPGRCAMFDADVEGDRVIYSYSNYVRKSIKNFGMFCESRGTELDVIRKAYKAGENKGCSSLPRLIGKEQRINRTDTYTVEISPLGYSPTLRSEHDIRCWPRMCAMPCPSSTRRASFTGMSGTPILCKFRRSSSC